MNDQSSPLTHSASIRSQSTDHVVGVSAQDDGTVVVTRMHFTRSALFSAIASSLVGFGVVPVHAAETTEQDAADMSQAQIRAQAAEVGIFIPPDVDEDTEIEAAFDAIRLRQAVEEGEVDPTVLEAYYERNISDDTDDIDEDNIDEDNNEERLDGEVADESQIDGENDYFNSNTFADSDLNDSGFAEPYDFENNNDSDDSYTDSDIDIESNNDELMRQATLIQGQGYQMMTPEQIERALADTDILNEDRDFRTDPYQDNSTELSQDSNTWPNLSTNDDAFDAPIATLDGNRPPLGLDVTLDAANLPAPTNTTTLGRDTISTQSDTDDVMSRPISVSDAVSSTNNASLPNDPVETLAAQDANTVTGADDTISETIAQARAGEIPDTLYITDQDSEAQTVAIDPDDYLPEYQTETQAVAQSLEQVNKPKTSARNTSNIFKRIYNRLFNGGVEALPRIETTVYLQQRGNNAQPVLVEADEDIQPINNIKAALDDNTVQSVVDFTAALPRLRQIAQDAAKAVGYYEVNMRLRQPTSDTIDVIIEDLGEPVRVDNRVVDVRGEGIEQEEFQVLTETLPPKEGDIFNHRVYKNSKAALESLSSTYGYFDANWLDKSVDIILPDNTADMSLIYDTAERYEFDDVVFFTYDKATNTLTRDPEALPVELSLLRQLYDFEAGDPFYRPAITKFTNDLSATRYFNTVNVESILPPTDRSSTLTFDNDPTATNGDNIDEDVSLGASGNVESKDDSNVTGIVNTDTDSLATTNATQPTANAIINSTPTATTTASSEPSPSLSATDNQVDDNEVSTADNRAAADSSTTTVNAEDVAPLQFEVDEETQEKLQAIKDKAERLVRLPDNRVLDEKDEEAENFLGKISDSISDIAEKIFPEEESLLDDEDFVPPTLEGRISPEEVLESKQVPLYVFVYADKPRDAQVGLGYGTDTGVRATGRIDNNLINRQGYQAGLETEISRINKNVTVYGSRPWKHPLNDKLDARLTYQEEVIDQGEGNFDLSTQTLQATIARNIRKESGWNRSYSMRYRLDKLDTDRDDFDLEDLPVDFTSGNPKQRALLFGYGLNKTTVDSAINPTRGIRQYYSAEAGFESAFSDTDLAILRAGVSGIYSFGEDEKHQVLGSLNGGYIWADNFYDVPYKLRFFAGGDQSIRGYDYESLSPIENGYLTGGQVLAVGSAEYNYEFRPGFRGAVFSDVGNAYDKNFDTETKVGVGVGIRWASPVGVVRVDVAAGVTETSVPIKLHFFIGSPL